MTKTMQKPANKERAKRILSALRTQYGSSPTKGDIKSMITDALTDIRHLCDNKGLSYWDLDTAAQNHYTTEIYEEKPNASK